MQTVHKRGYRSCVCVEGQKLLEQKERVYANVSAYQKTFVKVQLVSNFNWDLITEFCRNRLLVL